MSKADWSFLELLLEQGQEYSTGVGQVWLTVLFLFRVLVLSTAAESVWGDEQSDFVCNTLQPGCEEVCYDKAFPISHFRFFILQVIAVASPTIFYFSYAAVRAGRRKKREEEEERRKREEEEERRKREEEEGRDPEVEKRERDGAGRVERVKASRLKGKLLWIYLSVTILKLLLEVTFILVLWHVYGFTIPAHYVCQRWPCPHTVDCFVSRPKEKTIFTVYMQVMAGVSLLFNLLEVCVLVRRCISRGNGAEKVPVSPSPERGNLPLPAGKGGATPRWEAGIGWGGQYALGVEPVLFGPHPSLPRLPQVAPRGSRTAQWHYPQGYQQGGASL